MARLAFNYEAVKAAADAAVKTDAARAEARKALLIHIKSGASGEKVTGLDGNDIPTMSEMKAVANDFVNILTSVAGEVPGSIAAILQDTTIEGPADSGDTFVFRIVINGNLHRDSLYPAGYGGVDNIVALFDKGYEASHHVYGYNSEGKRITSRISRNPMGFMGAAAAAFNAKYSGKYNVVAKAGWS